MTVKNSNITQSKIAKSLGSKFYGIFGSSNFDFSNNTCAETIAAQCRDIIVYMQDAIRYYFSKWHDDLEIHKMLNLTHSVSKIVDDVICYSVSDSAYINMDLVMDTINPLDNIDIDTLTQTLYNIRLKPYFEMRLKRYCEKYNVENRFEFRLDGIYSNVCFFATNNYIMYDKKSDDIIVKGNFISHKTKGMVINAILKDFAYLLLRDKVRSAESIQNFLLSSYKRYCKASVDDICTYTSIGNIDDENRDAKACRRHNDIISSRYAPIVNEDIVCMYVDKKGEYFAFIGESYPVIISPEMDYKAMFFSTIIENCNRVIEQIGLPYVFNEDCDLKVNPKMIDRLKFGNAAVMRYVNDGRVIPRYLIGDLN